MVGIFLIDRNGIGINSVTGIYTDKSARLDDAVKCGAIHYEVLYNRESLCAPGFHHNRIPIFKSTHVQLADGVILPWPMCLTINEHAAHTANPFPAIMIEGNGIFTFNDQLFVQYIKHF